MSLFTVYPIRTLKIPAVGAFTTYKVRVHNPRADTNKYGSPRIDLNSNTDDSIAFLADWQTVVASDAWWCPSVQLTIWTTTSRTRNVIIVITLVSPNSILDDLNLLRMQINFPDSLERCNLFIKVYLAVSIKQRVYLINSLKHRCSQNEF